MYEDTISFIKFMIKGMDIPMLRYIQELLGLIYKSLIYKSFQPFSDNRDNLIFLNKNINFVKLTCGFTLQRQRRKFCEFNPFKIEKQRYLLWSIWGSLKIMCTVPLNSVNL